MRSLGKRRVSLDQGVNAITGQSGPCRYGTNTCAMLNHAQRELVALVIASGSIIGLVHTVTPVMLLRLSVPPRSFWVLPTFLS